MQPQDFDAFVFVVERFERAVQEQRTIEPEHYDKEYFASSWRDGDNRYDLATRRGIEARNPELIVEVFAPQRVLDVGCGPGFLMFLLRELGTEVQGVDFSSSAHALAPSEVREHIVIGPVTDLAADSGAFDLVVCREVLEHLTVLDVRRTVAELCRVSSRYVYVTTRFNPRPSDLLDFTTQFDVDPTHVTLLAKDFLRLLFVLEGFRRRADLEERMDWGRKNRVLVYEWTEAAGHPQRLGS